jgi:membrane protein DedA with SNARE-associated domain
MVKFRNTLSTGLRAGLVLVMLVALALSVMFGLRSYRTLVLLHSAQEVGMSQTSSIRAWMTLRYVAATYSVYEDALVLQLELPAEIDPRTTLRSLANQQDLSPFAYVQIVQAAIADIAAHRHAPETAQEPSGWFAELGDRLLSAVLVYGYPALGLTLFVGAIGAPVPTGLAMTIAGSLASQGHFSWLWTLGLAVAASVLGDLVAYAIGLVASDAFLARRGRWFGYTSANRARVESIFARWGGAAVLLTRTLVSHFSSVVSILAGVSRFRLSSFIVFAVIGRILWTAAYFGLGLVVGTDVEAASGFLANLSLLLISAAVVLAAAAGVRASTRYTHSPP